MNRQALAILSMVVTMILTYMFLASGQTTEAEATVGVAAFIISFLIFLHIFLQVEEPGRPAGDVKQEVHFHGHPGGYGQAQPVYYPQPQMAPPQPQVVYYPQPQPVPPPAPQYVMLPPEAFAQMQAQPGAQYRGDLASVHPGYAMQPLIVAPDGRYIPAQPMPALAPPTRETRAIARRIFGKAKS